MDQLTASTYSLVRKAVMNDHEEVVKFEEEGIKLLKESLDSTEDYQVPHVFIVGGASVR